MEPFERNLYGRTDVRTDVWTDVRVQIYSPSQVLWFGPKNTGFSSYVGFSDQRKYENMLRIRV